VPADEKVVVTGVGAGPVVVGTTGDAATPLKSSRNAAALEEGILVVGDADRHTGYGLNQCIVDLVDGYLIRLKIPKNETVCR